MERPPAVSGQAIHVGAQESDWSSILYFLCMQPEAEWGKKTILGLKSYII